VIDRSMISATAMMDASSSGQIGHPAAWMIANNSVSPCLSGASAPPRPSTIAAKAFCFWCERL
jgi:hypothetical protein